MKVSLEHIDNLQSRKSIKALALAFAIKEMYVSSAVNNYNPHSLQKKLAQSNIRLHHTTITKYVQTLMELDLAYTNNGCLIIRKLYHDKEEKIRIKKGFAKSFKDYVHFVRGAILKRKMWQAEYVYNKKRLSQKLLINPSSPDEYRRAKRLIRKWGKLKPDETQFEYKQSIQSFCNEFNCSIGEIYTTLKFLIENGWLKVKKSIVKLCEYVGGEVILPNTFVYNGCLYLANCNVYSYGINKMIKKPIRNKDSKK